MLSIANATGPKPYLAGLLSGFLSCSLPVAAHTDGDIHLAHWWVSPGEQAGIAVIREYIERADLHFSDTAIPGSGTARYYQTLNQLLASGSTPTASQVIGYDIHLWARQGRLVSLDDVARKEEWNEVIPYAIQQLSMYDGHWYAAPFNVHSTNWLWVNQHQLEAIGGQEPDTWDDFIVLLEKARQAGIIGLAIGNEPWEQTLLFESVAAGVGGVPFYRRNFLELAPQSGDRETFEQAFGRMRKLQEFVGDEYTRMVWSDATQQVHNGEALLQVQGSWVDGEFTAENQQPGTDYQCFRFPDTQGMVLFNADQYMLLNESDASADTRRKLASLLMDSDLQRDVNLASGAIPARVDATRSAFGDCGQKAISDMRNANMRRTLMGSVAMGNAHPAPIKEAVYRIVARHFQGDINDRQASEQLVQVLTDSKSD
ncbi:ABC transporter substrate-binding protein [Marinobacter zhejiangensis]|uniref:Probable sugar-binding periplasmic protein n=1 Tax=Marinobacter zhejiangensis TaxID=488535 RepID=A0A1I4PFQ2_9GAMM|nr:ABC transporter substrate-binding protein [Marinobacter zhejiangensis]SFM26500.1 carbohydrate ABC transporter substrate-binding protein, CUT1 family (TC 3.A.1.1.-) [Marinobacter zhejiangensis]